MSSEAPIPEKTNPNESSASVPNPPSPPWTEVRAAYFNSPDDLNQPPEKPAYFWMTDADKVDLRACGFSEEQIRTIEGCTSPRLSQSYWEKRYWDFYCAVHGIDSPPRDPLPSGAHEFGVSLAQIHRSLARAYEDAVQPRAGRVHPAVYRGEQQAACSSREATAGEGSLLGEVASAHADERLHQHRDSHNHHYNRPSG